MDKKNIILFLENFEIEKQKIDIFFQNKKIVKKNNNIYLIDANHNLQKNQIFSSNILFINLKSNYLPSKFILDFISQNSNVIKIKNEKQAINFTFGKNLHTDSINYKINELKKR